MKKHFKVSLYTMFAVIILALFATLAFSGHNMKDRLFSYYLAFGFLTFVAGIIDLILGLVIKIAGNTELSQSFFLAGGIVLLIGVGVCGPAWLT